MSGVWRLTVRNEFSSAHALRHYQGKCENMHGHNFTVEICVQGSKLEQKTEMLVDFKVLKNILKDILSKYDHHFLNETPPFDQINPTSENLARHFFKEFEKKICNLKSAKIISATVCEKPGQCACYMEES